MTERKPCVRCARPIDRYARLCVYCNWDQSEPAPAKPEPAAAPAYVPPADTRARNRLLGVVAFVGIVIIAFVVGTLIHGFEPNEVKAASNTEAAPAASPKSNVTLVPFTESGSAPVVEPPITSAPSQTPGQEASDATALPSDQYASVAAKAKEERRAQTAMVDPRTVRGRAYDDEEAAPRAAREENSGRAESGAPAAPHVVRTEAFPEYEPMPSIDVPRDTAARLMVTVGANGRVEDIEIIDPVPGAMPRIVGAVQNWRFRPATINGTPVPAKVTVTITLHANE